MVYNNRVVVGDVGYIRGLVHNRDVLLLRNNDALNALGSKLPRRDKTVLLRAEIVIVVCPIANAGVTLEMRFGR